MKLVTYANDGTPRLGAIVDERVVDLSPVLQVIGLAVNRTSQAMIELLSAGVPALDAARAYLAKVQREWRAEAHPALEHTKLLAPVPRPGKIVAIGRNYADHAAETGVKPFENPRSAESCVEIMGER